MGETGVAVISIPATDSRGKSKGRCNSEGLELEQSWYGRKVSLKVIPSDQVSGGAEPGGTKSATCTMHGNLRHKRSGMGRVIGKWGKEDLKGARDLVAEG